MKKQLIVTAMLAMALTATACSKKKETVETTVETTAETTTAAEITTEAEDIDEDSIYGYITAIDGNILTVQNDDDQSEKNYDITDADITKEYDFAVGDYVEIIFPAETAEDPVPAMGIEVIESVIAQNSVDADPSEEVTIDEVGTDTVTVTAEDGKSYVLNTANAYIVAENGLKAGSNATITYIGDLDDSALAVKIVMEDSYDTDEAERSAFTGKIASINDDSLVLISADDDFYSFYSDEIDFSEYEVGDRVQVFYTGSISEKEIPAVEVVKK